MKIKVHRPNLSSKPTVKKTPNKKQTRERLLSAAMECFAINGYEATSVRMIATKADVAFQLIAYYFDNKEELWITCLEVALEDAIKRMTHTAEVVKTCPPKQRLKYFREWLRAYFKLNAQKGFYRRIITHEFLANSSRYKKIIVPIARQMIGQYKLTIEEFIEIGLITRHSFEEVITIIPLYAASNALLPYEIEMMTGFKVNSKKFIEWEVDLVMNFIFGDDLKKLDSK